MPILIVTNKPEDWPFQLEGVDVVEAWSYITDPRFSELRGAKVFNLCRSYKYQSTGYYVSLLAEARGHRPLPSITTLQDLRSNTLVRYLSDELDELIQRCLAPLQSEMFTLSVYFGRNMARRYERLSLQLFNLFQSPLLRFKFVKQEKWQLRSVRTISGSDVPASHRKFVAEAAEKYFAGKGGSPRKRSQPRYELAILHDPASTDAPSDAGALKRFVRAAERQGMRAEMIERDDYGRLAEFDALFIRETTFVNHHTYRFARRAAQEGLVVIDDPVSISRCTNKVFLAELLDRYEVPTPRTIVVHKDNADRIILELGFPCVLKKPDSAFSKGVVKVECADDLQVRLEEFFDESELIVAQEFLPTTFDWRIGILDRKPLFACKYFMAPGHWQIIQHHAADSQKYGKSETLPVELAPRRVISLALKAANLIGDGLYGVDVKQSNANTFHVMEVNDNPNIEHGVEDQIIREELYNRIMEVFLERIEQRKTRTQI